MPNRITLSSGEFSFLIELNDSGCSRAIFDALPQDVLANRWGAEIYFDCGVSYPLEDGCRAVLEVGEVGYWPTGRAFCIFFGPTPASGPDGRPVAASEVNIIGRAIDDPARLNTLADVASVRVEPQPHQP